MASLSITKFADGFGNNYASAAIKLVKARVLGLLLYGAQLSIYKDFPCLEAIQK